MPDTEKPAFASDDNQPTASLGSSLCTQCGLCCTGALHNYAVLDEDEIEFARALGLKLRTHGRPGFALPCKYLRDCSCTIYSKRPKVCARYVCQLLEDVREGSTPLDVAVTHVRVAKQLYEDVRALLPASMTIPEARQMSRRPIGASPLALDRSVEAELRLAVTALCIYLDKHFMHSKEAKLLTMTPVDQGMTCTEEK